MRILDLARKDLLQIVRDWKSFLFLLVMPIMFTLVFGFAFGGFGGGEETDVRLPVGFLDRNQDPLASALYELLEKSDAIRPVSVNGETNREELEKMVSEDEIVALIVVPAGYGPSLLSGESMRLTTLLKKETVAGATAQNEIQAVVKRLADSVKAARFNTDIREERDPFGDEVERQAFLEESLETILASWDHPPFTLTVAQTDRASNENEANAFAHSSPGMTIQFAITGLIGAAGVLVNERNSGSLQRLLTTYISRTEILLGHFLAMILMILAQFIILIGFATLFLGVGYQNAPLATTLITLATTLFVASLGLLIGTLAKKEEQVVIFALIPMFVLSGLGGAWVPLEFTNPTFQTIGHFTPVAWAMDGFQNIILRGLGVESVLLPSAILLAFAAVLFGLAVWRFSFEQK